ncbi:MAG: adenylyl-sulfate kinase [Candidatus Bathyarchaeia archaeon]
MKADRASKMHGEDEGRKPGWAVWITGLPASGKSTVTASLIRKLREKGVYAEVLESDKLRQVLTPQPTYSEPERDHFYNVMVYIGHLLSKNGVNVIFDATGNKRAYRERARALIPAFVEVYLKCPLQVAMQRDRKGTYALAETGRSRTVPGLQSVYEEPLHPDVVIESDRLLPDEAADIVLHLMAERGLIPNGYR